VVVQVSAASSTSPRPRPACRCTGDEVTTHEKVIEAARYCKKRWDADGQCDGCVLMHDDWASIEECLVAFRDELLAAAQEDK